MTQAATKQVGQVVDGKFRLGQFVGGDELSSVFLVDYDSQEVPKAAIKLIPADSVDAPAQLARWRHAAKLSHPHLIRILEMGRCELDSTPMLYVVMEYAEENLSQVIARRPLSPAEARDILGPVVDALAYVHAKGFVHCRLKPANVMADDDLLKISSDGLCRIGEYSGSMGKPGDYDPPEAAGGRISPAGDVWSLGMTLAEALTQRLPVWERTNQAEPALPSNLPPEILDLARHCLRRDPQLRWTVADIAARLQQNSPAPPRQITQSSETSFVNPRAVGGVVLAGVALVAILGGLLLLRNHSPHQPPASVPAETLAVQKNAPGNFQPKPQPAVQSSVQSVPSKVQPAAPSTAQLKPENKPSLAPKSPSPVQTPTQQPAPASKPQAPLVAKSSPQPTPPPVAKLGEQQHATSQQAPLVAKAAPQQHAVQPPSAPQLAANSADRSPKNPDENKSAASTPAPLPIPARSGTPVTTAATGVVRGKVIQQILPDAPQKARNTIRGKVRLTVKVHVNDSGNVTEAALAAPGPSQYFADRTLKAAQLWKFTPAKLDGRNVPSDWLLHFEIDPASITVYPKETTP
ncbi:MAG TPA: protein kinase [Candidatus Acidoferrales bacterium]|nr:protein kinase [Candidatus Acidoferrales bacterium]